MKIGFATCENPQATDRDFGFVASALRRRGAEAEQAAWDKPGVDWAGFDLVVPNSTWDYHLKLADFLGWIDEVSAGAKLVNPAELIRWNHDKRYLRALAEVGVPTIPTVWTEPDARDDAVALIAGQGWKDIVIKPVVDLGAERLARVGPEHVEKILGVTETAALAQPYLESIETAGELSLMMLGGAPSHCVRKLPAPGDFRIQTQYGGTATPVEPPAQAVEIAELALSALPAEPTYARADLIEDERGGLLLIELELIEPRLYLEEAPGASERLARLLLAEAVRASR